MLKKLLLGVAGIYGAYITMSILSQKLFNNLYENIDPSIPPEKFTHPPLLIWLGALFCALAGSIISKSKNEPVNPIPIRERILLGMLYTLNISTTNFALLYISYPFQVIGRNTRFLFVVLIGAFFSRVKKTHVHLRLGKHKIFTALLITAGVLIFSFAKGNKRDKADAHDPQYEWIGYILLLISVICDAFFSDSQAYSKANFKPTANQLYTITNLFAFFFSIIYSILVGSLFPSIQFVIDHPVIFFDLVGMGLLQVIGQISIYFVVANFKQHVFPLISTTRKMITVLVSIFYFGHTMANGQYIAIGIVFLGMFYELYEQLVKQKKVDEGSSSQKSISSDSEDASPQKQRKQ